MQTNLGGEAEPLQKYGQVCVCLFKSRSLRKGGRMKKKKGKREKEAFEARSTARPSNWLLLESPLLTCLKQQAYKKRRKMCITLILFDQTKLALQKKITRCLFFVFFFKKRGCSTGRLPADGTLGSARRNNSGL